MPVVFLVLVEVQKITFTPSGSFFVPSVLFQTSLTSLMESDIFLWIWKWRDNSWFLFTINGSYLRGVNSLLYYKYLYSYDWLYFCEFVVIKNVFAGFIFKFNLTVCNCSSGLIMVIFQVDIISLKLLSFSRVLFVFNQLIF